MRVRTEVVAVGFVLLSLGACQRAPADVSPAPMQAAPAASQAPVADTSVPPADSVLKSTEETAKTEPAAGRSNAAMSRAQESSAMPMPGQNNDHSAPAVPAKRASSP